MKRRCFLISIAILLIITSLCAGAEYTVTSQDAISLQGETYSDFVERYDEGNLDYFHVVVPEGNDAFFEFRIQAMIPGFSGRFNFFDENYELLKDYSFEMGVGDVYYRSVTWENTYSRDYTIYIMAESYSSGQYSIFLDFQRGIIDNPIPGDSMGENEPNDSFSTSTLLEEGTMNGDIYLESFRDDDLLKITIPKTSIITININFTDFNEYNYYEIGEGNKFPSTYISFHLVEDKNIESFLESPDHFDVEFCYLFRDETDELIYENNNDEETIVYLAIEGDGKYSIQLDFEIIQQDVESKNGYELPDINIILPVGVGIIIVFVVIMIIYAIKKANEKKVNQEQMLEYHFDNIISGNQALSPQSYVVEADVVEEIEL